MATGIHANRWNQYLREMFRVTRPGGWCQMVELYYNVQSDNGSLTRGSHSSDSRDTETNFCQLNSQRPLTVELQIFRKHARVEGSPSPTEAQGIDERCGLRGCGRTNAPAAHLWLVKRSVILPTHIFRQLITISQQTKETMMWALPTATTCSACSLP